MHLENIFVEAEICYISSFESCVCKRNFRILFVTVTFPQITREQITVEATVVMLNDKHVKLKFRPRCVL